MSADTVKVFAYIFWALSGGFLVLSFYLFFKLNIKMIADDLSGRKAAREIRAYRESHAGADHNTVALQGNDVATKALNVIESTTVLEQKTEKLSQVRTLPLESDNETTSLETNSLVLDEMVIHTAERI